MVHTTPYGLYTVVQSTQGRDRYRVFLVTEIDLENDVRPVVIADGSLRKLASRKHKNPAHLRLAACPTDEEIAWLSDPSTGGLTDKKILTICKKYDFCGK